MAFSIKHPEADRLARKLAKCTGESLTEAVLKAIEERLRRVEGRSDAAKAILLKKLDAISDRCAALPVLDDRTEDEILGYDEFGLPS